MDHHAIEEILGPYLEEIVEERVREILYDAEKSKKFEESEKRAMEACEELEDYMDMYDAEEMVNAVKGSVVPLYEHFYVTGVLDGFRLCGYIDHLKGR